MRTRREEALLGPALLVTLAVLVSAWPLGLLFEVPSWRGRLLLMLLVVAATGVLVRMFSRAAAPIMQTVALLAALAWMFAGASSILSLTPVALFAPVPPVLDVAQELVADAVMTIRTSPAPAPTTPGVIFVFTAGFALVGLVADMIAVTLRRPLGAVVPLLVPFLAAVANLGERLPWYYLASLVGVIALMLADNHHRSVRRWVVQASEQVENHPSRSTAAIALWAAAVVIALTAAATLPHASTRYLADGLGSSGGGGQGQVGFTPYPDLLTDLRNTDTTPVLEYQTDDPTPAPLKVSATSQLGPGGWEQGVTARGEPSDAPALAPPIGLIEDIPTQPHTIEVTDTRLEAPYLASPAPIVSGSVSGARWNLDPTLQMLVTDARPSRYSMTYLTMPERVGGTKPVDVEALLRDGLISTDDVEQSPSTPLLRSLILEATGSAQTPAERADAIQRWLREDPSFTYSLDLPPAPQGSTGIDAFLTTRTGYCTHFATTMILMAREEGIPARLATGFLPGVEQGNRRVVRSSDAHAWPELYLDELGWVRYEPTPSVRAGIAPGYAPLPDTGDAEDPEQTAPAATPTAASQAPSAAPRANAEGAPDAYDASASARPTASRATWVPLALLVLLALGLAASPMTSRLRHRRTLAHAGSPAEQVEEHWRWTTTRLADLGITAPPAATVRGHARHYRDALNGVDSEIDRLIDSAETARYARSPHLDTDRVTQMQTDSHALLRAAGARTRRRSRLRAALLPSDGLGRPRRRSATNPSSV